MGIKEPTNDPPPDWRELRRQDHAARRAQRRAFRENNAWVTGAILVLLGVVLLAQNLGAFTFRNWWALFILIPAVGLFATAWNLYTHAGMEFTPTLVGPLTGGLVLCAITAVFLFDLNWGLAGPLILILVGIGAFLGGLVWRR